MGTGRTRRKNARKRSQRRAAAALSAQLEADERRTREDEELERMRGEERSQRTHERWAAAVERSAAEFERRRRLREAVERVGGQLPWELRRELTDCKLRWKLEQQEGGGGGAAPGGSSGPAEDRTVLTDAQAAMLLVKEAQARAYEAMRSVQTPQPNSRANQAQASITRAACVFYSRTGACPFGRSGCARVHENARSSKFLLLRHMFDPLKSASASPTEEASKKKRFVAFYEDVLAESQRFGTVTRMEILQNESHHLVGNVYIEFASAESAFNALQGLQLRWYAGKHVNAALVPMMSWEAALCGPFLTSRCARGNESCNYLHCHNIPDSICPTSNAQENIQSTPSTRNVRDVVIDFFETKPTLAKPSSLKANEKKRGRSEEDVRGKASSRSDAQFSQKRDESRSQRRRSHSRERERRRRSSSQDRSRQRKSPSRSRSPRRRSRSRERSRSHRHRYERR